MIPQSGSATQLVVGPFDPCAGVPVSSFGRRLSFQERIVLKVYCGSLCVCAKALPKSVLPLWIQG
jgi:hypothetical protein